MNKNIIIYTSSLCGFCYRAKSLLKKKNIPFEEIDIDLDYSKRNEMIKKSDSLLICDTNLFETMVYSKYYYDGICDPLLEKYALENSYDLYLLTNIDIPWVKDDLRDKPHEREESFQIFKEELEKNNIPFKIVEGDFEKRFNICKEHIDQLIKDV